MDQSQLSRLPLDQLSTEAVIAAGIIGIITVLVFLFIALLMMAGSMRLSTALMGNNKPNFIACFGWVTATCVINSLVVYFLVVVFGKYAAILSMPLLFTITLYIISIAADCGWFQAFAIHLLNSFVSTVGLVILAVGFMFALAAVGSVAGGLSSGDNPIAEGQLDTDGFEFPQATPVSGSSESAASATTVSSPASGSQNGSSGPMSVSALKSAFGFGNSSPSNPPAPKPGSSQRTSGGATANPFFNQ